MKPTYAITQVATDTDWDFFFEIPWRAHVSSDEFTPGYPAWLKALAQDPYRNHFIQNHKISFWILKRDCMPIGRFMLWSRISEPAQLYLDVLDMVAEEAKPPVWVLFDQWLMKWSKERGFKNLNTQSLLPFFESQGPKLETKSSLSSFQIKSDSPAIKTFEVKIEKARILSKVGFAPTQENDLPEIYRPWWKLLKTLSSDDFFFSAQAESKTLGFILALPDRSNLIEHFPGVFREHRVWKWKYHAWVAKYLLSAQPQSQTKNLKIFWIASSHAGEELGLEVILINELMRRAFAQGYKTLETHFFSKNDLVLMSSLQELQATEVAKYPLLERDFSL